MIDHQAEVVGVGARQEIREVLATIEDCNIKRRTMSLLGH